MATINPRITEAKKIYEIFWDSYTKGDLETFASTLDDTFEMIGTSETEVCHSKADGIAFFKAQMEEVVGKVEMRNRQINVLPVENLMLVNEQCDIYVLTETDLSAHSQVLSNDKPVWTFYSKIRISTFLREAEAGWKVIQQHGSLPDMRVQEGETMAIEKITKENLELKDAVKRRTSELENKNRELAIEAALEKVRAVATGMKTPEDMLDVCRVISDQLQQFGVEKIRNVQLAIIDENIGQYLCYQYFAPYGKTTIEKTEYLKSPVEHGMVRQMLASRDGYFIGRLSSKELEDFRIHRKEENHFPDPFLDKAIELDYCFLSIGEGGLGLTLYQPIAEDVLTLFKRFHQVFSLAYQRFRDIQKAEAQAREAQIEAALERVRSRSMAMHKSEELLDVITVVSEQLHQLGLRFNHVSFANNEIDQDYKFWSSLKGMNPLRFNVPFANLSVFTGLKKAQQDGVHFYTDILSRKDNRKWHAHLLKYGGSQIFSEEINEYIMRRGMARSISINPNIILILANYASVPYTEEENKIITRFGNVFEQSYTRFLDLQKAEAQVREAQIEAALERVRAQTMAMHSSEDVGKCVVKMFSELTALGVDEGTRFGIGILNHENENNQLWTARKTGEEVNMHIGNIDMAWHPMLMRARQAWLEQVPFHKYVLEGEDLLNYYQMLNNAPDYKIQIPIEKLPKKEIQHCFIFEHGFFYAFSPREFQPELIHITKRFSALFEQTYRRYLDLVRAETQAREAEIELALERVRARTMAMQHSDELTEASEVLDRQVRELGIETWGCAFHIYADDPAGDYEWFSSREGSLPFYKTPRENFFLKFYEKGKAGETFHVEEFLGEDCKVHYDYLMTIPVMGDALREIVSSGASLPESQYDHIAFFKHGFLLFITYQPVPESHSIFQRFAKVFEQTYTRFLDLQKAEAQAREAQIEAALERVRSRAMAMHNSQELKEVALELRKQMGLLGQKDLEVCAIHLYGHDEDSFESWSAMKAADSETEIVQTQANFPKKGIRIVDELMQQYKNGSRDYVLVNEGEKIEEWFMVMENNAPELHASIMHAIGYASVNKLKANWSVADFSGGALVMVTYGEPDASSRNLLRRSANVFEQAYIRFLDLQKAEAQAREAQIEAALERVRSRSLAMHKSDELNEVVSVLFEKLKDLQIPFTAVGIAIRIEGSKDLNGFVCGQNDSGLVITNYRIPYFDNPIPKDLYSILEKQLDFYVSHYSKEEKDAFYNYVIENTAEFRHLPEDIKRMIFDSTNYTISMVAVKNAVFNVNDFEGKVLAEEEVEIIQRFARVFDQAYTRFLDLQKAEAQAREARIEAALERVRAKAMAMHNTSDLANANSVVFDELNALGISPLRSGIGLVDAETRIGLMYATVSSDHGNNLLLIGEISLTNYHILESIYDNVISKQFYHIELNGQELKEYYDILLESYGNLPKPKFSIKETQHGYFLPFEHGTFYAWTQDPFDKESLRTIERFVSVINLTYNRYFDLKKAEDQAKEAQIELSLERIRSQVTAMQESSDLLDIVVTMRTEFVKLGHEAHYFWHMRWLPERYDKAMTSGDGTKIGMVMTLPRHIHGDIPLVADWEKTKEPTVVLAMEVETAVDYVHKMITLGDFEQVDPQAPTLDDIRHIGGLTFVMARTTHGEIGYSLPGVVTNPPKNAVDTLIRFAGVFDLAYKRFEDLKSAERQHREAQIELGLERVRARTMAMQKSEELADAAFVLFEQLRALGGNLWGTGFGLCQEHVEKDEFWFANENGVFPPVAIPNTTDPAHKQMYQGWLKKTDFLSIEKSGAALKSHYDYMLSLPEVRLFFQKIIDEGLSFPEKQQWNAAYFSKGYLLIITLEPYPEPEIFKRFAKVFEQTYTRFLDLQRAETQAREAKIEAALEKVRSRTMGMQSSDELPEVANLLFTEVRSLGIPAWSCGYNILAEDKKTATAWMSSEGIMQTPFQLRLFGEASFDEMGEFILSDHTMFVQELGGKALEDHYAYMKTFPDLKSTFENIEAKGISLPTYQINHLCKFTSGFLMFITYEPVPDAHGIFKRFTSVFDQTYTRFLDLKKAEAQTREAQIENALEKVRSRSLAMQSPDELIEVAQLLREEMGALGVEELETSSIYIQDESSELTQCWFTIKNPENPDKAITDQMTIDLQDTWVGRKMDEFYRSKAKQTSILMQGEGRIEWIRYCEEKSDLFGTSNFYGETIPDRTYHLYKFSNGFIGAAAPGEISSESWELLKRATAVFSFAYTRFRDLQMAQASARTAMRQASLDRVRADISSMRNADDLDRITPLIFKELTVLGVPFIRCGVFIIQEKQKIVEAYLSSPEGNSLGVLRLPYKASELTYQTVEAWRKGEVYKQHWNKEDFIQWIKQLMKEDQIQDGSTYQGTAAPPESLDLHFVPFAQGMLYVGAVSPLDEKELELVQTLAKAFSIAYARFEDFVKLEQAKAEVESAMSELKATQSQLVQQEKLASLGQLTAGIAHEIKNPLNFVNNFSEVSIEMIEEIKEERAKSQETRDETLVDDILEDIQSNLGKIYEHGSRANGIVTSMLQHSRGGSGKMEPTDLNALIKEYVNLSFHGMRAGKNPIDVDIQLDLDPDLGMVSLIKEDFTRVVINLCNNAFDAMRGKKYEVQSTKYQEGEHSVVNYLPKLKVSTMLENGRVRLLLEDNGPGIPDEIKDKILQPFFTTKKGTEGTGLGLSITHDIVKAHGGELSLESKSDNENNKGTTFYITLPILKN
ncbi:ATP-binding protein [Aquiflexum lacus]|uniref:ATP-binding protein n=1 Tax=Aquiflexum lacus TaxID=2483805 RepID=UPI00189504F0|nr:ATP-binding protein [Aquiflexum lacus]